MKKNDLILFLSVILIGIVILISGKLFAEEGDTVIIRYNGKVCGSYPLNENTSINVNGTNTVKIEDGEVYMEKASCPDKLCMHQGKISDSSKKIVCLPNKVSVSVTKKSHIDKVVR